MTCILSAFRADICSLQFQSIGSFWRTLAELTCLLSAFCHNFGSHSNSFFIRNIVTDRRTISIIKIIKLLYLWNLPCLIFCHYYSFKIFYISASKCFPSQMEKYVFFWVLFATEAAVRVIYTFLSLIVNVVNWLQWCWLIPWAAAAWRAGGKVPTSEKLFKYNTLTVCINHTLCVLITHCREDSSPHDILLDILALLPQSRFLPVRPRFRNNPYLLLTCLRNSILTTVSHFANFTNILSQYYAGFLMHNIPTNNKIANIRISILINK